MRLPLAVTYLAQVVWSQSYIRDDLSGILLNSLTADFQQCGASCNKNASCSGFTVNRTSGCTNFFGNANQLEPMVVFRKSDATECDLGYEPYRAPFSTLIPQENELNQETAKPIVNSTNRQESGPTQETAKPIVSSTNRQESGLTQETSKPIVNTTNRQESGPTQETAKPIVNSTNRQESGPTQETAKPIVNTTNRQENGPTQETAKPIVNTTNRQESGPTQETAKPIVNTTNRQESGPTQETPKPYTGVTSTVSSIETAAGARLTTANGANNTTVQTRGSDCIVTVNEQKFALNNGERNMSLVNASPNVINVTTAPGCQAIITFSDKLTLRMYSPYVEYISGNKQMDGISCECEWLMGKPISVSPVKDVKNAMFTCPSTRATTTTAPEGKEIAPTTRTEMTNMETPSTMNPKKEMKTSCHVGINDETFDLADGQEQSSFKQVPGDTAVSISTLTNCRVKVTFTAGNPTYRASTSGNNDGQMGTLFKFQTERAVESVGCYCDETRALPTNAPATVATTVSARKETAHATEASWTTSKGIKCVFHVNDKSFDFYDGDVQYSFEKNDSGEMLTKAETAPGCEVEVAFTNGRTRMLYSTGTEDDVWSANFNVPAPYIVKHVKCTCK